MDEPKTVAEKLDAAQNGEEFTNVILGLFRSLEQSVDKDADG